MSSLYGRLFTYRANDKQTPLENYLTEALCDLLNRLGDDDPSKQHAFLKNLKLFEADDSESLYFDTQVPITIPTEEDNRIADFVGYINNVPVLVLEVKIGAEFTEGQLPAYGAWLAKKGRKDAVLALLTYKTAAPEDFKNGVGYAVKTHVIHWRDVRQELRALQGSVSSVYFTLAKEFVDFLDEQEITMEAPKKEDLNKLGEYLKSGAATKWQNFMKRIRARLKMEMPKHVKFKLSWESDAQLQPGGSFRDEADALIGWVNSPDRYNEKGSEILYISWGLYFAPEGKADPYGFHGYFDIPRVHGAFLNIVYREWQEPYGDKADYWYPLLPDKSGQGQARRVAFKALAPIDFDGDAAELEKWFVKKFEEACAEIPQS